MPNSPSSTQIGTIHVSDLELTCRNRKFRETVAFDISTVITFVNNSQLHMVRESLEYAADNAALQTWKV